MTAWKRLRLLKRSCPATGAVLDRFYHCGVRLVNFHTKLVGAFDAIILSTLAAMTLVITLALLNPSLGNLFETTGQRATVTIEQIA